MDSEKTILVKKNSHSFAVFKQIVKADEFGIFISLIAISFILSFATEQFLTVGNLSNILRQTAYMGTMAVGMVFVISQGDIDISVAAIYNLSVIIVATFLKQGMNPSWSIPVGIIIGGVLGLMNGALMVSLKLPAMIITLGTSIIYRSLSLVISNATTVGGFNKEGQWFFDIVGGKIGALHGSVIIMLIVGVLGYIVYKHTKFGRHICAIGANINAAKYAGIKVDKLRVFSMVLNGVTAAIAGMGTLAFLGAADPSFGSGSEMMVIAATIIGGASLSGGTGSVFGALIGAVLVSVIRNGLTLLGVSPYWQGTITGVTIISAVTLDFIIKRRGSR